MKKILLTALVLTGITATAQVKVGDNPTTINANSVLELESTNKGLLLPRVALTSTTAFAPLSAHVAGMKVYNTATAGDVTPGEYYNDGAKWVKLSVSAPERNITRNVYVDTADPNTATQFSTSTYYNNNDCSAVAPTASFTTNANPTLASQTDALYIAQSACDASLDYSTYSYWVWDGTSYIPYTVPSNTPFKILGTNVDAGNNKTMDIYRNAGIHILDNPNADYGIKLTNTKFNSLGSSSWLYNLGTSSTVSGVASEAGKSYDYRIGQFRAYPRLATSITTANIRGLEIQSLRGLGTNDDSGTASGLWGVDLFYGHRSRGAGASNTGTTKRAYGISVTPEIRTGTITDMYDYYAGDYVGSGTVTNKFGVYILGANKTNYFQGNVGVGTETPSQKLTIRGSNSLPVTSGIPSNDGLLRLSVDGSNAMVDYGFVSSPATGWVQARNAGNASNNYNYSINPNGGNVGIGTTTPSERLSVSGNVIGGGFTSYVSSASNTLQGFAIGGVYSWFSGSDTGGIMYLQNQSASAIKTHLRFLNGSASVGSILIDSGNSDALEIVGNNGIAFDAGSNTANTSDMFINTSGNVGIGTTTPTARLDVAGEIRVGQSATAPTPQAGMIRYNTSNNKFEGYTLDSNGDGTANDPNWVALH